MRRFETVCRVRHSAENMFALVANVETYPQFVPLCEGLNIRARAPAADGSEVLTCDMTVGYKAIQETFTSEVTLQPQARRILVSYVSGPFRSLDNRWTFRPQPDGGCEIDFFIAYEFRSMAFQLLAGAVFDRAFAKFVDAFRTRADDVYGAENPGKNP